MAFLPLRSFTASKAPPRTHHDRHTTNGHESDAGTRRVYFSEDSYGLVVKYKGMVIISAGFTPLNIKVSTSIAPAKRQDRVWSQQRTVISKQLSVISKPATVMSHQFSAAGRRFLVFSVRHSYATTHSARCLLLRLNVYWPLFTDD